MWSVGAGLLQPIFQAGRIRRNLEASQARLTGPRRISESRTQRLPRSRQFARDDSEAGGNPRAAGDGRDALLDASDLSRERYDSGLASYIEILTADRTCSNSSSAGAGTRR